MTLYTKDLKLLALDVDSLRLLIEDIPALEKKLGVSYKGEPINGMFKNVVKAQLSNALADEKGYLWYTFWLITRKTDGVVAGSADFKGAPDDKGNVEIGYGLASEFEHRGYMTQAVNAMCEWALNSGAGAVLADTEPGNLASQAVLERCGFVYEQERDGLRLYVRK